MKYRIVETQSIHTGTRMFWPERKAWWGWTSVDRPADKNGSVWVCETHQKALEQIEAFDAARQDGAFVHNGGGHKLVKVYHFRS